MAEPSKQKPTSRGPTAALSKQAAAYQFLPLECPNCGFKGKAKISRLDRTFQCKQCKKTFHVTFDNTVTGERPPEEAVVDPGKQVIVEKPSWLEKTFSRLPPAARWAVGGLIALALAFCGSLLMEPEKPLPGELEDRALLAAKSFGIGDWSTLKRLAKSRTAGPLSKWYDKNRPADWNEILPEEMQFEIVSIKQGLQRYEKGTPIMDARETANIGPRGKKVRQVLFLWSQTEVGEWWLDGVRMLKESKVGKKAAAPPEQRSE